MSLVDQLEVELLLNFSLKEMHVKPVEANVVPLVGVVDVYIV
jgi:hypothetical protein